MIKVTKLTIIFSHYLHVVLMGGHSHSGENLIGRLIFVVQDESLLFCFIFLEEKCCELF